MIGEVVLVNGVPVENVLVEPGAASDASAPAAPAGAVVAYTLRFPESFEGALSDAHVTVRGRECRTIGHADHYRARDVFGPSWALPWDMTVLVELVAGDLRAEVRVLGTVTDYDELGDPVTENVLVYEGAAQARRATDAGSEESMPDGSKRAVETWFFVIPWQEGFAALRPESTVIDMGGADYDVASIEDVDGRREFASFKGVRRG